MRETQKVIGRIALKKAARPEYATEIWITVSPSLTEAMVRDALKSGAFTATMRFGDRTAETMDRKGGYVVGRPVRLRIQYADGTFAPNDCRIVITRTEKKEMREITDADVARTMFTGTTKKMFAEKFGAIYKRTIHESEIITIVTFTRGERNEIN